MFYNNIIFLILCVFFNFSFIQTSIIAQTNSNYSNFKPTLKKNTSPTKNQRENWQHLDFDQDTILGASIDKAYLYASKNLKVKDTIIVAVIDSDPDLNHEDLQGKIWVNPNEIPNNNIDDDNGYIDDIHGWNFTSSATGKSMIFSLMEETRIIQKYKDQFSITPLKIKCKDSANYKKYIAAKASYDKILESEYAEIKKLEQKKLTIKKHEDTLKTVFSDSVLTISKLIKFAKSNKENIELVDKIKYIVKQKKTNVNDSSINATIARHLKAIEISLNTNKDNRSIIIKDNLEDLKDTKYGSPKFSSGIDHLVHSTSVSSVLAANRNNNIGIKGVAEHTKVMFLNIGTFGDFTDKDLALSIKYAVDNGARIINISQSKKFSLHEDWVDDALKYAEKHNVLIVTSSGNSNLNLSENVRYPNDFDINGKEFVTNYITVGANSYFADKNIKWSKSNYGKNNVDLYAPGRSIKVSRPYNKYAIKSGTSHAAPIVSGIAAIVLSYFPELSASQLKEILLTSGISFDIDASIKDSNETIPFSELSKSGKVVNAYNALLMAKELSKK